MITETELTDIEARVNAATPGPWEAVGWDVRTKITADDQRGYLIASCQPSAFPENGARNAEFLSHTREDVPALIAEVRRLQSENARQALLLGEASATVRCDECGEHASLVLVKQCFYCNPPEEAE